MFYLHCVIIDNNHDQAEFMKVLPRLRNAVNDENTVADWKLLLKNQYTDAKALSFKGALRLFPDNESCNRYNKEKLRELEMPIAKMIAINTPPSAKDMKEDNFNGLRNEIFVSINAKVILLCNIWTQKGLVNGATGIIRDIIYSDSDINKLPVAVLIEFDRYNGPPFFLDEERKNWIPINPYTVFSRDMKSSRTQLPFLLSYALTIHKSQGATLLKAVIDLGSFNFSKYF